MRICTIHHINTLAALFLGGSLMGQPCTQQTVTGTYALSYEGTVLMAPSGSSQPIPAPAAGLGIASVDSDGKISAPGYNNLGGNIYYAPMPGTMKVSADCTGTIDWGGGVTAAFVILSGGNEINSMMVQGGGMGSPIIHGTWKRISKVQPVQCSPGSVFGTYAFRESGTAMVPQGGAAQPVPVPFTMVGIVSMTNDGTYTGAGTASLGGQPMPFGMANGKVQVNPDCTAAMTANITSRGVTMGQVQAWGVVLDGGDTIWGFETQEPAGKPIALGTMTRISRTPPPAN